MICYHKHKRLCHENLWHNLPNTMKHRIEIHLIIEIHMLDFPALTLHKILVDLTKNLSKSQSHIYDFQMATTCNRGTRTAKSYQAHRCSASGAAIWTQRSVLMIFSRSCSRPHPCLKVFPLPLQLRPFRDAAEVYQLRLPAENHLANSIENGP